MSQAADELTPQQLRFLEEYAVEPNATQSYLKAYPHVSYNTAKTEGARLLTHPYIAVALEDLKREYRRRTRVNGVRVIKELASIAFSDLGDLFEESTDGMPTPKKWNKVSIATRRAVQSVKIKRKRLVDKASDESTEWEIEEIDYRLHPKMDALTKLCANLGISKETMGDGKSGMAEETPVVRDLLSSPAAASMLGLTDPVEEQKASE